MLRITHTILYSKGWYKRTNIWEDLKATLKCDDYEPFDNRDIISILVSRFDSLPYQQYTHSLSSITEGISKGQCWKHGYYTKDFKWNKNWEECPEWDYDEAIVRYILSVFSSLNKDEFLVKEPDYEKCLPKSKN